MDVSRRNFIKGSLGLVSLFLTPAEIMAFAGQALAFSPRQAGAKVLVLVQLAGGNDGLNCVVPYGMGSYYQARPDLAINADQVLVLNNQIGLNPNMTGMAELYKKGKLAVVQAVGYPGPNRSHFRSIEIWQTAAPTKIEDTGWLGRYLDLAWQRGKEDQLLPAVNVDPVLPKTLSASRVTVPSVSNPQTFRFRVDNRYPQDLNDQLSAFKDIYADFELARPYVELLRSSGLDADKASDYLLKVVGKYQGAATYPQNNFGQALRFISQMIVGGVSCQIYHVSLPGFDTHANQMRTQNNLLKTLSDGLASFQADLEAHGEDKDVLLMTYSEFGRRVAENGGRGTDHGTAAPLFIMGSATKGGVYGDHPSLSNLDYGDLKYKIDFRSVYATILDRWLFADSRQVLGANFDQLGFV